MRYFQIGTIVNTHGVKGEVKILPTTDDLTIFDKLKKIEVFNKTTSSIYKIKTLKYHKQFIIVKLEGINTLNEAELLKTSIIKVTEDKLTPLVDNEYFITDLYGIKVITTEGEDLGIITDIVSNTMCNDIYYVKNKDGVEILIPAIKKCIIDVNIQEKIMTVFLLEGLR